MKTDPKKRNTPEFSANTEGENIQIIEGLASEFTALYCIDLDTGLYRNYMGSNRISDMKEQFTIYTKAIDLFHFYVDTLVYPEHREALREFYTSDEGLRNTLRHKKKISIHFKRNYSGVYLWTEAEIFKCEAEHEEAHTVLFSFSECDDTYRGEQVMKECIGILGKEKSPKDAINELLILAREFYGAEYARVFEFDADSKTLGVTCEICAPEAESMISHFQGIPAKKLNGWLKKFANEGAFWLEEPIAIDQIDSEFMHGVNNLITVPMQKNGKNVGAVCVVNSTKAKKNATVLKTVAAILFCVILKRQETEQRQLEDKESRERESAAKDQVLSAITQALYGFNLTVNLERGTFNLITGTGAEDAIKNMEGAKNYRQVYENMTARIRPEYHDRIREMLSLDYLWMNREKLGYYGTIEYQTIGEDEVALWEEVNVTFGRDGEGHPIANLLGRDITSTHREKALQEREIKVAQAKNEVLSGITQTLYGFNVTANLVTNTHSLITGTGTELLCGLLDAASGKSYTDVVDMMIAGVPANYRDEAYKAIGREVLLGSRHQHGYLGTRKFPWVGPDGMKYWCEINTFMGENEKGEPIANLLGRNITQEIERQEQQEHEREAASAKDRVLSEITQELYGYNLTVNLRTLKYTVITGTGMDADCEILKNFEDYEQAIQSRLELVVPNDREKFLQSLAVENLRAKAAAGVSGPAGVETYEAYINGEHQWNETNIFIGTDTNGEPIANILGRNITEQHNEQERREREARAAAAKDQILSGITQALYGYNVTVNLETLTSSVIRGTGLEDITNAIENTHDYQALTKECLKRIPKEQRSKALNLLSFDAMRKLAQDGVSGFAGSVEYESYTPKRKRQWHEINLFIGTDENGAPVANLLARDVTEKHNEQERREREARAAAAKDQILSGITQALYGYNITLDLDTLECSVIRGTGMDCIVDALERSPNYDTILTEGRNRLSLEDQRKVDQLVSLEAMRATANTGKSGYIGSMEFVSLCPIHGKHWHEINLFISSNAMGHPIANLLGRDVTEQHERMELQEREREAASAKDRILSEITRALYGYNLTVNLRTLKYSLITGTGMEAACDIFKRSDDYAEAVHLKLNFIAPHDRERIAKLMAPEALQKMAKDGKYGAIGVTAYEANVNGQHQWHETNIFIGADANGDPIANILGRDITEQRSRADAEAQLLAAQEANKAKTAFLFNMSHDIRTPMNAIRGFTDIAKKNLDNRARMADCLHKIDSSGELLLSLINSILDMSRIESGKAKLEEIPGDIRDSFRNIETTMQVLAKGKGISLSFTFGKVDNYYIYTDFDRCNRVFLNIISNAIKYSHPNGYVKVKCEQAGAPQDGKAWYRYTFEDNGIGMSEEFQGHLFEEFARERNSTTSGIQGTGLGLAVCKSFVDLMGGKISCQSRQGEGTTFTVMLPLKLQTEEPHVDEHLGGTSISTTPSTRAKAVDLTGRRVLLVEDNDLNREIAMEFLSDEGLLVDESSDGSIAVQKVKENGANYYAFILMDIQMPIMDGYEATKAIRCLPDGDKIPIIALSANAFEEDRQKSLAAGMNAHEAKPIRIKSLFETIRRLVTP